MKRKVEKREENDEKIKESNYTQQEKREKKINFAQKPNAEPKLKPRIFIFAKLCNCFNLMLLRSNSFKGKITLIHAALQKMLSFKCNVYDETFLFPLFPHPFSHQYLTFFFSLLSFFFYFSLFSKDFLIMTYSREDAIPLTDASSGRPSVGPSVGPSTTPVKQAKGEFATSGVQPSFALELDISTIQHVIIHYYSSDVIDN